MNGFYRLQPIAYTELSYLFFSSIWGLHVKLTDDNNNKANTMRKLIFVNVNAALKFNSCSVIGLYFSIESVIAFGFCHFHAQFLSSSSMLLWLLLLF